MPAVPFWLKVLLQSLTPLFAGGAGILVALSFRWRTSNRRWAWILLTAGISLLPLAALSASAGHWPTRHLVKQVQPTDMSVELIDGNGNVVSRVRLKSIVLGADLMEDHGKKRLILWTGNTGADATHLISYDISPNGSAHKLWSFNIRGLLPLTRQDIGGPIEIRDVRHRKRHDGSNVFDISVEVTSVDDYKLKGEITLETKGDDYKLIWGSWELGQVPKSVVDVAIKDGRVHLLDVQNKVIGVVQVLSHIRGARLLEEWQEQHLLLWTDESGEENGSVILYKVRSDGLTERVWVFRPGLLAPPDWIREKRTFALVDVVIQKEDKFGGHLLVARPHNRVAGTSWFASGLVVLRTKRDGYEVLSNYWHPGGINQIAIAGVAGQRSVIGIADNNDLTPMLYGRLSPGEPGRRELLPPERPISAYVQGIFSIPFEGAYGKASPHASGTHQWYGVLLPRRVRMGTTFLDIQGEEIKWETGTGCIVWLTLTDGKFRKAGGDACPDPTKVSVVSVKDACDAIDQYREDLATLPPDLKGSWKAACWRIKENYADS